MIRKYGLDAAEIEALEAQGKTDDEINAANEKRIKEQMAESDNTKPETEAEKRIAALMPGVHNAVIGYILTSPSWSGKQKDDGYVKEAFEMIRKSGIENLNKGMLNVFAGCEDADNLPIIFFDFSKENLDNLLKEQEDLIGKCTPDADKLADKVGNDHDALVLASDIIKGVID